jgi:HEPN domain-containing protein
MPPEKLEEVRAWMIKAARDLTASARLLEGADPLCDVVVYHCQQAAEKALKGYLTWRDSPFAKTHSLVQLVEQARLFDEGFGALVEHAEDLSPFAWRFRYPGDVLDPGETEARRALAMAGDVVELVKQLLPEGASE